MFCYISQVMLWHLTWIVIDNIFFRFPLWALTFSTPMFYIPCMKFFFLVRIKYRTISVKRSTRQYCTLLYCTVSCCIVLYRAVLFCTVLNYSEKTHSIVLCTAEYSTVTLYCITAVYCSVLVLQCTADAPPHHRFFSLGYSTIISYCIIRWADAVQTSDPVWVAIVIAKIALMIVCAYCVCGYCSVR